MKEHLRKDIDGCGEGQQGQMSRKQMNLQTQKGWKGYWMEQYTLCMEDVSHNVKVYDMPLKNLKLAEAHMSLADAAAWYAKHVVSGCMPPLTYKK